jgi:3-phosphoshikimate 1-carboxyvinyltransferase
MKVTLALLTSHPVSAIAGSLAAPGDKSCSHRALILGGLASGTSEIGGLLEGDDVRRTGDVMRQLGADVVQTDQGVWRVTGVGEASLSSPEAPLDFGNSGTGSRLLMGVMAGHAITAKIIGDASLSSRPMARITEPLSQMGVRFETSTGDTLPLTLHGTDTLQPIAYTPPHASAQVKSAILLAGLRAHGTTSVSEARMTRDHSERMLKGFGAEIGITRKDGVRTVSIAGGQSLSAQHIRVPGDPSSAAFLIAASLISAKGDVLIENVMSNETRDGFFRVAELMGASLGAEPRDEAAGERLIDLQASSAPLKGVAVPEHMVPAMIDEFPILAVLAAFATGETRISGAAELRVKESDRISATVNMLRVNGVEAEETEDGFVVQGCAGNVPGGGHVTTHHDHRIAMSALVMGTAAQNPVSIDDASMIDTSYPAFADHMRSLGADFR